MKTLEEIKLILVQNKSRLHKEFGLTELAVFGSYSRNDQTEKSDIDILVDFDKPVGLEFIELAIELENLLGLKVDLVSKNGIKPRYFGYVKEELIYV